MERINYHEAVNLTKEQIHLRLGELAINRVEMNSRQLREASTEAGCLVFELNCREDQNERSK